MLDFTPYVQTVLGVAVSVVLFLFGYRQTIGARKERIRVASQAVHRMLFRRMVLESYEPRVADIARLIEGTAKAHQVPGESLPSADEILTRLYIAIFDNDLINPEQRIHLEASLSKAFAELDRPVDATRVLPATSVPPYQAERSRRLVAILALSASMVGTLTVLLFGLLDVGVIAPDILAVSVGVFLASLASAAAITAVRRAKEGIDISPREAALRESLAVHRKLTRTLEKLGARFDTPPRAPRFPADYIVGINGRRLAIEVVPSDALLAPSRLQIIAEGLRQLVDEEMADDGIILVADGTRIPTHLTESLPVRVIRARDVHAYLRQSKPREAGL